MAVPLYTLQLKQKILSGRVTIGKYDGSHSCITAATTGDKVMIHSPHLRDRELSMLNVNQVVSAISAGKLNPNEEKDILVIGTQSTLLAYHVENNTDLFYKEVTDGANVVVIGKLGNINTPLAIVGGNCSIQGFDWQGNDPFWTVTGDNVRSLSLLDIDHDEQNELIVGSDDFDLRVFKEDALVNEISETEAITSLVALKDNKFAYSLANGTVGVYDKLNRAWRVKSKNAPVCLSSYDIDGDGVPELITGWSNGKVDARNSRTGEVVFHDVLGHGVAGLVTGDYTMSGKSQLIACSVQGEIRGYDSSSIPRDTVQHGEVMRELFSKKQALLSELKNYTSDPSGTGIPANTRLLTEISVSFGSNVHSAGHVVVSLSTNNLTVIRSATVFAEGIFEGETFVVHPRIDQVTHHLDVPLVPPKDTPLDIHIRAFVGSSATKSQFHVFEVTRQLPRFSMYNLANPVSKVIPDSFVTFRLNEKPLRLESWQSQNFLVNSNSEERGGEGPSSAEWRISLTSLRDGSMLQLKYESGTMTIATPHMSIAADIIQSLAQFFNLTTIQSFAEFPNIYLNLRDQLNKVEELQQNAAKMSANVADTANIVRGLIVQAEDSRLLQYMKDLRECYSHLQQVNSDLIRNYSLRSANHKELLQTLRNINAIVQHASRLRVGKAKNDVAGLCRTAIATKNINLLIKTIKTGEA
ncbi:BBSome complex member BBS2-like isoform X1 [Rhodnius prolixus]|uniref:BBSome complex member BBS2-like isoform X1 n=1 Tax=Rhodnius prolixus TaxID=13249 RepID=UPI003D18DA07